MAKNKISEFDVNPDNNTDINNINIAEGCAPSGINNAIRQLMSDLKEQLTGASGDPFTVGGAFAANGGATLGDASGDALTINSSAVSIPNGLNFDSNTFVIDATNDRVGVGTASPTAKLDVNGLSVFAKGSTNGITIGDVTTNSNSVLRLQGTSAGKNFQIANNLNVGGLEFTPSTADGGTTYTTPAMVLTSAGNVGIGTSSPTDGLLHLNGGTTTNIKFTNANTGTTSSDGLFIGLASSTDSDGYVFNRESANIKFGTANTERMRIDSSGNVGIGTSSPAAKLDILGSSTTTIKVKSNSGGSGNYSQLLFDTHNSFSGVGQAYIRGISLADGNSNTGMTFGVNSSGFGAPFEAMRIDSAGNLLVGQTSRARAEKLGVTNSSGQAFWFDGSTGCGGFTNDDLNHYSVTFTSKAGTSALHYQIGFFNSVGSNVGSITHNNTNTTYSTSSDYRLKENIAPMTGALATVALLKPCTYTWKSNGEESQGFIAHELQAVIPDAVVGEKDAVNEDGSIKPQGIDTSYLVATLTAAIQEQQAIITDLKARIENLESK